MTSKTSPSSEETKAVQSSSETKNKVSNVILLTNKIILTILFFGLIMVRFLVSSGYSAMPNGLTDVVAVKQTWLIFLFSLSLIHAHTGDCLRRGGLHVFPDDECDVVSDRERSKWRRLLRLR